MAKTKRLERGEKKRRRGPVVSSRDERLTDGRREDPLTLTVRQGQARRRGRVRGAAPEEEEEDRMD